MCICVCGVAPDGSDELFARLSGPAQLGTNVCAHMNIDGAPCASAGVDRRHHQFGLKRQTASAHQNDSTARFQSDAHATHVSRRVVCLNLCMYLCSATIRMCILPKLVPHPVSSDGATCAHGVCPQVLIKNSTYIRVAHTHNSHSAKT